jgi:hypothetical protein
MTVGNDRAKRKRTRNSRLPKPLKAEELSQIHKDLEGLERLQALQSTLIGEIRRQIERIRAGEGQEQE